MHYEKFADGTVKCIEDEIPFELPEGWAWSRLQSFCFPITDGTHQTPTYSDEGYIFLSAKNVTKGKIDWDNVMHIPESLHKELYARIAPQKNDILLAKNGTVGVAAIVDRDCIFDIYVTLAVLRTISEEIVPQYLLTAILSSTVQAFFKSSLIGIGVQNLHLEHIRKTPVPIPPTREQKAIAHQVNLLEPYILKVEEQKNELYAELRHIKSKILDLAIRGKLVPQDPNDEPASVLLERIRAEKEELIKQGKIKRDKKESIIFKGDDNSYYEKFEDSVTCIDHKLPFTLPDGWSWCVLPEIAEIVMGSSPDGTTINTSNKGIEFHQGKIFFTNKLLNPSDKSTTQPSKTAPKDSVLLCVRAPVGELNITDRLICIGRGLASIHPYHYIDVEWLFYWLQTYKGYLNMKATGSTFVAITADIVKSILIPLPPLEEQEEILKTINKVFFMVDLIEKSLN